MHRASLVLGALLTVAFVTAPGIAGSARAQGSQDPGNPAYGQQQGNDQREEGEPFDQRRGDDHVRADTTAGFGLTRDAFHRLAGQMTDALGSADDDQAGANA